MLGMRRENSVSSTVIKLIKESLRTDAPVTATSLLSDLGLDSMAKMSLAFRVEEVFSVDLTRSSVHLADIRTVDDIVRAVTELKQGASKHSESQA